MIDEKKELLDLSSQSKWALRNIIEENDKDILWLDNYLKEAKIDLEVQNKIIELFIGNKMRLVEEICRIGQDVYWLERYLKTRIIKKK